MTFWPFAQKQSHVRGHARHQKSDAGATRLARTRLTKTKRLKTLIIIIKQAFCRAPVLRNPSKEPDSGKTL